MRPAKKKTALVRQRFILQNGMTLVVALALAAPSARAQNPAAPAAQSVPGAEQMDPFAAIAAAEQELVDAGKVAGVFPFCSRAVAGGASQKICRGVNPHAFRRRLINGPRSSSCLGLELVRNRWA